MYWQWYVVFYDIGFFVNWFWSFVVLCWIDDDFDGVWQYGNEVNCGIGGELFWLLLGIGSDYVGFVVGYFVVYDYCFVGLVLCFVVCFVFIRDG